MCIIKSVEGNQENNGYAKGVLYKVKNSSDETLGYLFGTIHKIDDLSFNDLHGKIVNSFDRSSTLFVEINNYNKENVIKATKLNLPEEFDQLSEDEINSLIEEDIKLRKQNPEGVDNILLNEAEKQGKKIEDIETVEFHSQRLKVVASYIQERKRLSEDVHTQKQQTQKLLFAHTLYQATTHLKEAPVDLDLVFVYKTLELAVEYVNCGDPAQMQALVNTINLFTQVLEIGRMAEDALPLKVALIERVKMDRSKSDETASKMARKKSEEQANKLSHFMKAWRDGNVEVLSQSRKGLPDSVCFNGDPLMAEVIHNNLLKASPENRGFYAMGVDHLKDNSENVKKILERKGWTVVDAYKKPENVHSQEQTSNQDSLKPLSAWSCFKGKVKQRVFNLIIPR